MNWIKPAKRLALYHRDGFCCIYCGATAEDGAKLGLDHLLANELGGSNEATNLVTACGSCNSSKCDLTMSAWFEKLDARGVDTAGLGDRIRTRIAIPLDMAEGRRLLAIRKAAKASADTE